MKEGFFARLKKKKTIKELELDIENLLQKKEELNEEISGLEQEIETLVQRKEQAVIETELCEQELEAYTVTLEPIKADSQRREQLIQDVSEEILKMNEAFKTQALYGISKMDEVAEKFRVQMQQIADVTTKEMDKNMKNAINQMVSIKRQMEGADYEILLDNYSSLQESLYYNSVERELGLGTTKISAYLNRFLRIITSLGYECVIPKPGDEFDAYCHEEVEARECEVEETEAAEGIAEVVAYGFMQDGFCVKKAKVTMGKSSL